MVQETIQLSFYIYIRKYIGQNNGVPFNMNADTYVKGPIISW